MNACWNCGRETESVLLCDECRVKSDVVAPPEPDFELRIEWVDEGSGIIHLIINTPDALAWCDTYLKKYGVIFSMPARGWFALSVNGLYRLDDVVNYIEEIYPPSDPL